MDRYTWKDIVIIGDIVSPEEHEIEGIRDDDNNYILDDFYTAVADKFGVDEDEIETLMIDDVNIDIKDLPYGLEACGCYINGVAEWTLYM